MSQKTHQTEDDHEGGPGGEDEHHLSVVDEVLAEVLLLAPADPLVLLGGAGGEHET